MNGVAAVPDFERSQDPEVEHRRERTTASLQFKFAATNLSAACQPDDSGL
jgi:hypothetical protein